MKVSNKFQLNVAQGLFNYYSKNFNVVVENLDHEEFKKHVKENLRVGQDYTTGIKITTTLPDGSVLDKRVVRVDEIYHAVDSLKSQYNMDLPVSKSTKVDKVSQAFTSRGTL